MSRGISSDAAKLVESEPLMAHLATCNDGNPHVAPVWYHYEDGVVELLTTGRKLANVRRNPRVALSIQKDEAGVAQWRVTLLGTATVVDDDEAARAAAARINPKYGSEADEWPENTLVRVDVGSSTVERY